MQGSSKHFLLNTPSFVICLLAFTCVVRMKTHSIFALIAVSLFVGGLCISSTSASSSRSDKVSVQAVKKFLNQLAQTNDLKVEKAIMAQRNYSEQEAELQTVLNEIREAKAQAAWDTFAETAQNKTALAQLYARLLEKQIQMQDFSDEEKVEMQSILSTIKEKLAGLGSTLKGGFNKLKNKVKNFIEKHG